MSIHWISAGYLLIWRVQKEKEKTCTPDSLLMKSWLLPLEALCSPHFPFVWSVKFSVSEIWITVWRKAVDGGLLYEVSNDADVKLIIRRNVQRYAHSTFRVVGCVVKKKILEGFIRQAVTLVRSWSDRVKLEISQTMLYHAPNKQSFLPRSKLWRSCATRI